MWILELIGITKPMLIFAVGAIVAYIVSVAITTPLANLGISICITFLVIVSAITFKSFLYWLFAFFFFMIVPMGAYFDLERENREKEMEQWTAENAIIEKEKEAERKAEEKRRKREREAEEKRRTIKEIKEEYQTFETNLDKLLNTLKD